MTEQKEPKMSAVAIMENWKVAVSKEMAVAAQFDENWGFLKATEQETKVIQMASAGFGSLILTQRFSEFAAETF
jgi:hypothetical protein